ncbi:MAG: DNA primase [Ruminococcaceae bacterium]|nr:DNA primase [Oscillospiraceae bacterium]
MPLPNEFIEQVRDANEITSVISSYTSLKRAGRDSVCLCPFHSEKTASCHIYADTQSFYCFGCGAGGDVINFIRLIEHLDYIESIKFLAQRANIPMPEDSRDKTAEAKQKMLEINRQAARFYRDVLLSDKGAPGRQYLLQRGLSENTIRKYGLGFAPNSWDTLKSFMLSKGYTEQELLDAALLAAKRPQNGQQGGERLHTYDKFRNRVMFPIIDRRGNIIGFGGRTLEADAPAKYLNSDETLVFHKRSSLFSLNFAKNTREKFLILCEGYMDVISLNQAGFDNAIATLGTAITPEQARLMRQYCEEVVISYDSDGAGQKATMKAINLLGEAGVDARVLQMTGAKDPDEYVKKYGADGFRLLLEKSGGAISFELKKLTVGLDMDTPEGKASYLKKAVGLLASINDKIDRMVYINDTAKLCGLSAGEIEKAVEERRRINYYSAKKAETRELINPTKKKGSDYMPTSQLTAREKAQRGVIAFMIHSPDLLPKTEKRISLEDFPDEFCRIIYQTVTDRIKNGQNVDLSSLGNEFSAQELGKITGIIQENNLLPYQKERLDEYIKVLEEHRDKYGGKDPSELTDEEMLAYMEAIRKKKSGG